MWSPKARLAVKLVVQNVYNGGVCCMCFLEHQDVKSQCSKVSNKLLSFFWIICFFEATAIEGGYFNCMLFHIHIIGERMGVGLSGPLVGRSSLHAVEKRPQWLLHVAWQH